MEKLNYNKLAVKAHQNAVNHGFWEEKNSTEHCLMLIVTEISEAVEAHRNGKIHDFETFDKYNGSISDEECFERFIKDSVADEMADVAIRLFDLAGAWGIDFGKMQPCRYFRAYNKFSFTENAFGLVKGLSRTQIAIEKRVQFGIAYVFEWAKSLHVNLPWHINAKMKYNENRPPKHGKLY